MIRIRHGSEQRLMLQPHEHGIDAAEVEPNDPERWRRQAHAALRGDGPQAAPLAWNLAVQRWLAGLDPDLPSGLIWAWQRLHGGAAERLRQELAQGCS